MARYVKLQETVILRATSRALQFLRQDYVTEVLFVPRPFRLLIRNDGHGFVHAAEYHNNAASNGEHTSKMAPAPHNMRRLVVKKNRSAA